MRKLFLIIPFFALTTTVVAREDESSAQPGPEMRRQVQNLVQRLTKLQKDKEAAGTIFIGRSLAAPGTLVAKSILLTLSGFRPHPDMNIYVEGKSVFQRGLTWKERDLLFDHFDRAFSQQGITLHPGQTYHVVDFNMSGATLFSAQYYLKQYANFRHPGVQFESVSVTGNEAAGNLIPGDWDRNQSF